MKVASQSQIQEIDRRSTKDFAIPSLLLMENASIAIAQKILELYGDLCSDSGVGFLVGRGNNGGDGMAVARYFFRYGIEPRMFLFSSEEKFQKDALIQMRILQKLGLELCFIESLEDWQKEKTRVFEQRFLVDALLGVGLKGRLRDLERQVVLDLNEYRERNIQEKNSSKNDRKILSIDVPSGLLTLGDVQNPEILRADETFSVGLPKLGMLDYPGREFVGRLHVLDIGFPKVLLEDSSISIKGHWITSSSASLLLPKRKKNTHKGNYGHVLVLAGSRNYAGAAILSCRSVLKGGAGYVTLASIPTVCLSLRTLFPEAITFELPEERGVISLEGSLEYKNKSKNREEPQKKEEFLTKLQEYLSDCDSVLIGPGLGREDSTFRLIEWVFLESSIPIVVDADALFFLSQNLAILKKTRAQIVLTPHIQEMSRIVKKDRKKILANKIQLSQDLCESTGAVLVLKSATTLITEANGNFYYNTTGNEGMATAGSGDQLAGLLASFLAQGILPVDSAQLACFLHGRAGDLAVQEKGSASLTASDVLNFLPQAFLELEKLRASNR